MPRDCPVTGVTVGVPEWKSEAVTVDQPDLIWGVAAQWPSVLAGSNVALCLVNYYHEALRFMVS